MAAIDSLFEQVAKSDLDIAVLLKLRNALDEKLAAKHRDLKRQLAAVEEAMADGPPDAAPSRRGRPARKAAGRRGRRGGAAGAKPAGKHAGMSVIAAVQKAIQAKGGKASAADIKKAFASAGDKRNLNFTLLTRGGGIKRVGFEAKKEGHKGRAGGIYAAA